MKLCVLSDLHLESTRLEIESNNADVVILAGDIEPVAHGNAPRWARHQFPTATILWVLGNHEYYGYANGIDACLSAARTIAREAGVQLLERDVVAVGDIRFLGCTLWTDFRIQGTPEASMTRARLGMSDFSGAISIDDDAGRQRYFRPQDSVDIFRKSVAWLRSELSREFDGKSVVVTHPGPHPGCEHPSHVGGPLAPAFCSDLEELIRAFQPCLWVSGHTHASHDFSVGQTRLISNQRGYRDVPEHADAPFRRDLTIEI